MKSNICITHPKLVEEWNYERNGDLKPEDFTKGSNKKVWWKCKKGHEWRTTINDRNRGRNCPYCSNKMVCEDNCLAKIHPKLVEEWNYEKNENLTPYDVVSKSGKKVWWKCKKGHEWKVSISHRTNGRNCPYCSNKKVCKDNCLKTTHPELSEEWNYERNGDLTPNDVVFGSDKKVWWKCKNRHEWETMISSRTIKKTYCPYCSNKKVCKDNCLATLNPKLAREWNYEKNGNLTPNDFTAGSDKKVWWKCKKGHEWKTKIYERNNGSGCPYCSNHNVCKDNCLVIVNPELAEEWNYEKNGNLTPNKVVFGSNKKVWWKCKNCNNEWETPISIRNLGSSCPRCFGNDCLKTTHPELAEEWNYEKNGNLTPDNIIAGSDKKFWWKCKNCENEWEAIIGKRIRGSKCPRCLGRECLATLNPELAEEWNYDRNGNLTPNNVLSGSRKKVWWKCKKCNNEWKADINGRNRGKGCLKCSGGKISKSASKWLDELNITEREKYIKVEDRIFYVDGFENNIIYEFLGDYWHGNPFKFNPNKKNKNSKKYFYDLLYETIDRLNTLSKHYKIIYRWETSNKDKLYKPIYISKQEIIKKATEIYNLKENQDILEII